MPFYDYRCKKCGYEEIDVQRHMTEDVSVYTCSQCQSEMQQIIRVFGFELKGKGWFKDGYSGASTTTKKTDIIDDIKK